MRPGPRIVTPELHSLTHETGEDIDTFLPEQKADITPKQANKIVAEQVLEVDRKQKALTGRTPEQIYWETGFTPEQVFPDNKKILYVGDPWQRMGKERDNKNLTILEYEFGEVRKFERNNDAFRERISQAAINRIEDLHAHVEKTDYSDESLNILLQLIEKAHALSEHAERSDYAQAAQSWTVVREYLEKLHADVIDEASEELGREVGDESNARDPLAELRQKCWYMAVDGERGFTDIPDWENEVQPEQEQFRKKLIEQGVDGEELEKKVASWTRSKIESLRLHKKPEHANVVEGIFPELPFASNSFDRFVASWSISAHLFGHLDREGYMTVWQEIDRVLRSQGEAYIFPITDEFLDMDMLCDTLDTMKGKGLTYELYDDEGKPAEDDASIETLVIKKR